MRPIKEGFLISAALLGLGAQGAFADTNNVGDNCTSTYNPPSTSPLFYDAFSTVNTNDWYYRETSAGQTYSGGTMSRNNVSADGSGLKIHFGLDSNGYPTGGGLISRHLFGYGYYEIQASNYELHSGFHQAFWSMGMTPGSGGDPNISSDVAAFQFPTNNQIVEIDGYETDSGTTLLDMGNQRQSSDAQVIRHGSAYYHTGPTVNNVDLGYNLGSDYTQLHTYAYEWEPDYIKFYVDGYCKLWVPQNSSAYASISSHIRYAPSNFWLTGIHVSWYPYQLTAGENAYMNVKYFKYWPSSRTDANWIGNADFEAPSARAPVAGANPPGWIVTNSAAYIQNSVKHSGNWAITESASSSYSVTAKQNLEYIPNGTYTLTAYITSGGNPSYAKMRVVGASSSEVNIDIPHGQTTWVPITMQVNVTTHKATIAFTTTGGYGDYIRVDDVSFTLN